jgi:hypothetical protein
MWEGRELLLKLADKESTRLRLYDVRGRLYQLAVTGTPEQVSSKAADTFLDSLRLISKKSE